MNTLQTMTLAIFHSLDLYKVYFHYNLVISYLIRGDKESIKDTGHGAAAISSESLYCLSGAPLPQQVKIPKAKIIK